MTKAIELASYLDEYHQGYEDEGTSIFTRAAAELRRLAAVEQEAELRRVCMSLELEAFHGIKKNDTAND